MILIHLQQRSLPLKKRLLKKGGLCTLNDICFNGGVTVDGVCLLVILCVFIICENVHSSHIQILRFVEMPYQPCL